MDSECIFCNISKKELPADIVHEDGEIIVFKDMHPKAPVHLLLVPKKHIDSVNNLCNDDVALIGRMVCLTPQIAKDAGTGEGYKLLFNVGRKGGQIVDHIHLHLMGGWQ